MPDYRMPLAYNTFQGEEYAAIMDVINSGRLTQGKIVEEFEDRLAETVGSKYAILVNSGSSATLIGLEAIVYLSRIQPEYTFGALNPGDEIITPGLSWPTTLKPLLNHGLQPVFCDVDIKSLNASVEAIDAVRTKRTRGVIAVPVLGNPEGLDEIRRYCEDTKLILFEDACESFGAASLSGRRAGRFGIASAFSFYFSHHISTIEGGAVLTSSPEIADLCYALRSHGWTRHFKLRRFDFDDDHCGIDSRFCFVFPGYNVRATEITAAIGMVQLKKFPEMLERRKKIAGERIRVVSSTATDVVIPGAEVAGSHSWMAFPMLFPSSRQRRLAQERLEQLGIETRPIIVGNILHHPLTKWTPVLAGQIPLPNCDQVFECGLMIGMNPFSTPEDEAWLADALGDALAGMYRAAEPKAVRPAQA